MKDTLIPASAKIWGYQNGEEIEQTVDIEYSGYRRGAKFIVNDCRVTTPLEVEPSDLYLDLCAAIGNEMRVEAIIEPEIQIKKASCTE